MLSPFLDEHDARYCVPSIVNANKDEQQYRSAYDESLARIVEIRDYPA
jgi:hypothetical protein